MTVVNIELISRELETARDRLHAQQDLLANSLSVFEQATATGSHALARIASVRCKRHRDTIAMTEKVIAELLAMLPPPPQQLDLATKSVVAPRKHSSST